MTVPDNDVYPHRREPPACPYCDRIMTWREKDEQGACNDCYACTVDRWGDPRSEWHQDDE